MKKHYVYLITEERNSPIDYVDAAFDSKEKAQAYLDRYKDNEAEIFVCEVNPEYHTNKTSNCYFVELSKYGDEPEEIVMSNKMASAKMAVNDLIEINPKWDGSDTIGIYLFATSEEEAIATAIVRRERAIVLGEI